MALAGGLGLTSSCGTRQSHEPAREEPTEVPAELPQPDPEPSVERLERAPRPLNMESISPEWVEELERLQGLLDSGPSSARAWLELGMAYEKCGMRVLARECYSQMQLRDPENPKSWYRSGICAWRQGDLPQALRDLDHARELEPSYAPIYYRMGIIEMDAGRFDAAWDSFERGIGVGPDYLGCYLGKGRILLQRDDPQGALDLLLPLAERAPSDAKINNLLVNALRQAGKASQRELMQTSFLGDTPDPAWGDPWQRELSSSEVISFKSKIRGLLRDTGEAERALTLLEARRQKQPSDWSCVDLQAQALFQLKRLGEARELYRAYIKTHPMAVTARINIAYYHEVEGTLEAGIPWLDQALRIDPRNRRAWLAKGRMLATAQQFELAYPALIKAREVDPESLDALYWLLSSLIGLQRWEESVAFFQEYVDRDQDNANVWLDFARVQVKLHHFGAGERALDRAVALNVGRKKMATRLRALLDRRRESVRKIKGNKNQ